MIAKIFKKIAKNVGFNLKTKIVFYEVLKDMSNPNVYFDTSQNGFLFSKRGYKKYQNSYSKILGLTDETLLELKYRILSIYKAIELNINTTYFNFPFQVFCNNSLNVLFKVKISLKIFFTL